MNQDNEIHKYVQNKDHFSEKYQNKFRLIREYKQETSIIKIEYIFVIKMFKKRAINKDSGNTLNNNPSNDTGTNIQKRPINTAIDLRKDIEEIEDIISTKQEKAHITQNTYEDEGYPQKHQNSLFKTKKINKFTSHILKNLPTRTYQKQTLQSSSTVAQSYLRPNHPLSKPSLQPQSPQQNMNVQLVRPDPKNYGLLDKSHFKSTSIKNCEVIETGNGKNHQQALMDYYVKKKMQQITKPTNPITSQSFGGISSQPIERQPETWEQVLQIQKQYLTQEEKIKEYSMEEIQKKLQKLAHQTIRTEIDKRNNYLKDLLQNEYERMEYASKKQLKIIRQDKERIERDINSKYRDSGRRNFIENIKNQVL